MRKNLDYGLKQDPLNEDIPPKINKPLKTHLIRAIPSPFLYCDVMVPRKRPQPQ